MSDETREGVTQTLLAGREDGVPGNCVQAAIATLLGLPIEGVPHVLLFEDWWGTLARWLAERGYVLRQRYTAAIPDGRCIVAGASPRGIAHVCVADHGAVVWDPHPSQDGLTEVREAWFIEPMKRSVVAAPLSAGSGD